MPVHPLKQEGTLPTTSWGSYLRLLDYMNETGMPEKIGPGVWRAQYDESLASKVRSGYRWLGLTEGSENLTTPLLRDLVDPSQRRTRLATLIRERYAAVLPVAQNPNANRAELDDAIGRAFGAQGQSKFKAASFLLGAAKYAGLPIAPQLARAFGKADTLDTSDTLVTVPPSEAPRVEQAQEGITVFQPTPIQTTRLSDVSEEGDPRAEFLAVVQVLARRIPLSRRWTRAQVDHFIKAVEANLVTLIDVEDEREAPSMNGKHNERTPV